MSVLLEALRKAQDERDRGRGIEPAPRPPLPETGRKRPASPAPPRAASPLLALGLAVAIFAGALSAWHSQPEMRFPARHKAEPGALKLDYALDLARPRRAGGTPPP